MVTQPELTPSELAAFSVLSRLGLQIPGTFYVLGGWAFDIWAGRKTREHSDIDLICEPGQWDHIGEQLIQLGGDFKRQSITKRIVLHGTMISLFKDPDDEVRPMSRRWCTVDFQGIPVPVMDAIMLLDTKENLYHRFGVDHYLHKDIHDIRLMRSLLEN